MTRKKKLWLLPLIILVCGSCNELDFNLNTYHVEVSSDPVDGGRVPVSDTSFVEGKQIELEAVNNEGFAFVRWSGDISTTDNPVSFIIYEDYNVVAHFEKKEYDLTIEKSGKGDVIERIVKNKTYEHGTLVELTARPGIGYEFAGWTGDINSSENPATIMMDAPKSVTADFRVKNSSAVIDVEVDWKSFDNLIEGNNTTFSDSISHFGVHLLYEPSSGQTFNGATMKSSADRPGLITMESTVDGSARLLATAVREVEGNKKAFFFGTLNNLSISFGTQYNWTVEDFSWRKASWRVVDSLSVEYEKGTFIRDRSDPPFELWILINTPYRTGQNLDILDLFVRVFDGKSADPDTRAQESGYENGFRQWYIEAENQNRPDPDTTEHAFEPYVVGPRFALPSERYLVDKSGRFKVIWQ